ncbi:MAG: lipocalin family protein [Saprospiraceae bacterium]|nr:lipocalin family protein [Saprospiraceae bacterium]
MKYPTQLLICFLFFSAFCKKENQPTESLSFQTIVNGPWIQAQYLEDQDGNGTFTDESLPCELDNTWVFNADTTMSYNDIGVLCAPDFGPISIPGNWLLTENDQVLLVSLSSGFTEEAFNIVTLNDTLMVLHKKDLNNPSAPVTQKVVLER